MAASGSYARGDEARSVPDPDRDAYDEMIQAHRARTNDHQASSARPKPQSSSGVDVGVEALVKVLNGPREARRQLEQGHPIKAAVGGVTAAADLAWGGLALKGLLKGHLKMQGPFNWRNPPWKKPGARQWMGEMGVVEKGQPAHHAIIPNNGWGKRVPDAIKNQPANIKPIEKSLIHIRIHGASRQSQLPRFNRLERYWYGTPRWWKAANASAVGHLTQAVEGAVEGEKDQ